VPNIDKHEQGTEEAGSENIRRVSCRFLVWCNYPPS